MNSHRACGMALAAALAATSICATSSATAANFDGYWSLVAQTTDGHCGVTRWDVAISDGQLYYPGGSYKGHRVGLGGVVSPSGRLQPGTASAPPWNADSSSFGENRSGKLHRPSVWRPLSSAWRLSTAARTAQTESTKTQFS